LSKAYGGACTEKKTIENDKTHTRYSVLLSATSHTTDYDISEMGLQYNAPHLRFMRTLERQAIAGSAIAPRAGVYLAGHVRVLLQLLQSCTTRHACPRPAGAPPADEIASVVEDPVR
jgi:hypothetical protein